MSNPTAIGVCADAIAVSQVELRFFFAINFDGADLD